MAKLTWKRKLGQLWPAAFKGRKCILLYHSLGNSLWAMSVNHFRDQINWLADNTQVLTLTDLIRNNNTDDTQVAITFDDGYQSLYDDAAAILANKNLSATVYLNTGWISDTAHSRKKSVATLGHYPDETFLSWEEVNHLVAANWLIGSHGVNHHNFSTVDEKVTALEFTQSKNDIEQRLNQPCLHFAYPFGRYNHLVKQIVKQTGYQYAVAARHGGISTASDLFALPRLNIEKHYSLTDFQHIVRGKWDYLNLIHKFKGL